MPLSTGGLLQRLFVNKQTDGFIAVSRPVAEALIKRGAHKEKVHAIHNGTPASKYNQIDKASTEALRIKFDLQPNDIVIGCVSRMKEQLELIKALHWVEKPVKVIFCGIEATAEMNKIIKGYAVGHQVYFEGLVFPSRGLKLLSTI